MKHVNVFTLFDLFYLLNMCYHCDILLSYNIDSTKDHRHQ